MKKHWLITVKRFVWICIIGFMIAWHNVYHSETRLRKEDRMEIQVEIPEEDEDRTTFK